MTGSVARLRPSDVLLICNALCGRYVAPTDKTRDILIAHRLMTPRAIRPSERAFLFCFMNGKISSDRSKPFDFREWRSNLEREFPTADQLQALDDLLRIRRSVRRELPPGKRSKFVGFEPRRFDYCRSGPVEL